LGQGDCRNLKSIFLCCQEALKAMPEGASIINISSSLDGRLFRTRSLIALQKARLILSFRALALEVAPRQITVNNVAPGAIDTPGAPALR
jgi:3-oxoacyl-[acyl-carrier protein] reductase